MLESLVDEPVIEVQEEPKLHSFKDRVLEKFNNWFYHRSLLPTVIAKDILVHKEHFIDKEHILLRTFEDYKDQKPNAYRMIDIGEQNPFVETSYRITLYRFEDRKMQ